MRARRVAPFRGGRWVLLGMRNAQRAAKESRLYDHALTSISSGGSSSAGSVESSRDVSRSQMATIALRNIQGIPRRGWLVKTLAGLKRRDPSFA